MSNYKVIADIGMYLINRLKQGLAPELIQDAGLIALCSSQDTGDFVLSLTLYDVQILNRSLFNNPTKACPLSLKYILSVNSKGAPDVKAAMDHHIIGRAIEVMNSKHIIRKEGNFLGSTDIPLEVSMENITIDERVKICDHVNGGFRTSVFYSIYPVFIDSQTSEGATRVING